MDADEDGDGGGWDVDDDLELPPDLVSNIIVQKGIWQLFLFSMFCSCHLEYYIIMICFILVTKYVTYWDHWM